MKEISGIRMDRDLGFLMNGDATGRMMGGLKSHEEMRDI